MDSVKINDYISCMLENLSYIKVTNTKNQINAGQEIQIFLENSRVNFPSVEYVIKIDMYTFDSQSILLEMNKGYNGYTLTTIPGMIFYPLFQITNINRFKQKR